MSSPSQTTNDMYEDIREGTSDTRNEGNNYNIYREHLARIICKAPVWYLCHYIIQ